MNHGNQDDCSQIPKRVSTEITEKSDSLDDPPHATPNRYSFSHLYKDDLFCTALTSQLNAGYSFERGLHALDNAVRVLDDSDLASIVLQLDFNFNPSLALYDPRHIHYIHWKLGIDNRPLEAIAEEEGVNPASLWKRGPAAMKLFIKVLLTCLRTQLQKNRYTLVLRELNTVYKFAKWQTKDSPDTQ